jgi:hypothetical protein
MIIVKAVLCLPFVMVTKLYIIFIYIIVKIKKLNLLRSVYASGVSIVYALCASLF